MESLQLIISLAGTTLGFIITTVTFLAKFIKNAKAKKVAQQTIEICNAVLPYIRQAEALVGYTGEEKKEYVMTKANQYAIEHKIKFDRELIGEEIEKVVKLTKEVNRRENDKKKVFTIPANSKEKQ